MRTTYTTLIQPRELFAILDDESTVVFDVRFSLADTEKGARDYADGHIPGSYYLDLDADLSGEPTADSGRHPLPNVEQLVEHLRRCGLSNDSQVVAYDDAGGAIAGRMWWLLKWLGHVNVAVLDGGLPNWTRQGLDVNHAVPDEREGAFREDLQFDLVITTAELEKALSDNTVRLIDARAPDRFAGKLEPIDPVAGHVPGAVNQPFRLNLDDDGCFRAPEDLGTLRSATDHDVCMCGSGVTACHNILASAISTGILPKLYVGSWSEWIRDANRPVATNR